MGILNATPDSFSDGGMFADRAAAVEYALAMVEQGARIVDVGGESTRPGAEPVPIAEEIERTVPLIAELRQRSEVAISIDTRRAEVARAALAQGADIVNDVSALADPEMAGVVSESSAGVVLMHMQGEPRTMQSAPHYEDVVTEVIDVLRGRIERASAAGISRERIVVDPGIGFGKRLEHNVELIRHLDRFAELGQPVLLGVSRKAFLGALVGGAPVAERMPATLGASVVGLQRGARIFRVHDVRAAHDALTVAHSILYGSPTVN